MRKSKNFGFNLPEQTDLVKNIRLDYNPNFEKIDELLKRNNISSDGGVYFYIASELPAIEDREDKVFYLKITNIEDLIDESYMPDKIEEGSLLDNNNEVIFSNDGYVILTNS